MINKKISLDIKEEFNKIRKAIQLKMKDDFEITSTKNFIQSFVPSEIITRSQVLLDTLLNYLMDFAVTEFKYMDVELRNDFFAQNLEQKIKDWVKQTENQLELMAPKVEFSTDPRWEQGAITGVTAFVFGTAATVFVFDPTKVVSAIITGLLTIIGSSYLFKKGFEKAEPQARPLIKSDIDKFINNSEKQVSEWLKTVTYVFSKEFDNFCDSRGLNIKGTIE